MFGTILETIKRLENRKDLSDLDKELLEFLHAQAWTGINTALLNLVTYGDRLGWEKIEEKFVHLLQFIQKAKEQE